MRNPAGASKGYAFAEFTLPGCAAACKEAWNKAGEALRPQAARDATGEGEGPPASAGGLCGCHQLGPCRGTSTGWVGGCELKSKITMLLTLQQRAHVHIPLHPCGPAAPKRVKLQRAEAAPVKTVSGLFGRVLYVDGLQAVRAWHGPGVVLGCKQADCTRLCLVCLQQPSACPEACLFLLSFPCRRSPTLPGCSASSASTGRSAPATCRAAPSTPPATAALRLCITSTPSPPTRELRGRWPRWW